LTKIYKNYR